MEHANIIALLRRMEFHMAHMAWKGGLAREVNKLLLAV